MLLEALEILQSAGEDENTYVTDFALYKVMYILTIYIPVLVATFLLSQEYLGQKVACFAPENFTDSQAASLDEYCWNNGFWISEGVPKIKSLYTQPHRYYPLYLPIQSIIFITPIIMWNVLTKSQLLAILRGTEEFLEELQECVKEHSEESAKRAKSLLRQFHKTLTIAAQETDLSFIVIFRLVYEFVLTCATIFMQYFVYNTGKKSYHCNIKELSDEQILCTVPVLDLLDGIWSINVAALLISLALVIFAIYSSAKRFFSEYQPLFFNELPYGEDINFDETSVEWNNKFTKHSYELLAAILSENNSIVTKVYCIRSITPPDDDDDDVPEKKNDKTPAICENTTVMSSNSPESKDQIHPEKQEHQSVQLVPNKADKEDATFSSSVEYSVVDGNIVNCTKCGGKDGEGLRHRSIPGATPLLQDKMLLSVLVLAGFALFSIL